MSGIEMLLSSSNPIVVFYGYCGVALFALGLVVIAVLLVILIRDMRRRR